MTVDVLIEKINTEPDSIDFTEVINTIEETYNYTPTRFHNGTGDKATTNEAGADNLGQVRKGCQSTFPAHIKLY